MSDLPPSHKIGAREAIHLRSGLLLRGAIDGGGSVDGRTALEGVVHIAMHRSIRQTVHFFEHRNYHS
jgi:hypothetical protein